MSAPSGGLKRRLSDPSSFTLCLSLGNHYDCEPPPFDSTLDFVAGCVREGRVRAFFIPGGASGRQSLEAQSLAEEVLRRGGEPLLSLSLGDRSREEALDILISCREKGLENILLVTGDYPRKSDGEDGRPFFDVDSVQLLMLLGEGGKTGAGDPGRGWYTGCAVSPFKSLEPEQAWQYARLRRKVEAGADFIVSQAGSDPRTWDELIRFCRLEGIERPVLGNVLVADLDIARRARDGLIPGVTVPPPLFERIVEEERGGRKGREARLHRAAASVAVLRGLGYNGALLSGSPLDEEGLHFLLDEAEGLAPRWEECLEETSFPGKRFYYFRRGAGRGLNEDRPGEVEPKRGRHPMYVISEVVDHVAFGSRNSVFRLLYRTCSFCDKRNFWKRALWVTEYLSKRPMYGCRMCGDCTLYACAFLCYEAGCPKRMLNGPCGGSLDGYCEVHPGKKRCFWVRVYDRLKGTAERPSFVAPPIPPKDRRLDGTCSWISFCLGRDHRKLRIDNGSQS